ncbi:hypothetical protein DH2020_046475 [Rehmannia glutinosa]|uniref:Putative plant transposon protein domain-containing protein n=1 Tax=Rehmannia glutinosa TaxID=99300 RepID=A0ABR0UB63_REHGL
MVRTRKGKGKGKAKASTSADYDTERFVSQATQETFFGKLMTRRINAERGFQPGPQDGHLHRMIRERQWQKLCAPPPPFAPILVKEFYANASDPDEDPTNVYLRGERITYTPADIREYYSLPAVDHSPYTDFLAGQPDLDMIVHALCRPDTECRPAREGGGTMVFSHTTLSRYGRAWYHFLCQNLMPTSHLSDVTPPRARLLYAIIHGIQFDAAVIIAESIHQAIRHKSTGGMCMPALICGLGLVEGIVLEKNEPLERPKAPIDSTTIAAYEETTDGVPDPRGEGP